MESNPSTDIFSWNLKCLYASTMLEVTVAGIQLFMWIYMTSRFKATPKESKPARFLNMAVSFALLWLTTANAVINAAAIYHILFLVVPGDTSNGWEIMERAYMELYVESELIWTALALITDSVLVYRCYGIWFDRRWAVSLPLLLLLANIGIAIKSVTTMFGTEERDLTLDVANIFISALLHIIITALICGKLVHVHRKINKALSSKTPNPFLGMISILIESAAPLAVFGLATAINVALPPSVEVTKVGMVVQILYNVCMALSLQLIIFRVAMGWSWADRDESSALMSQQIRFADQEDQRV
ncbi:hypothetical protein BKA70DRAFT_1307622 [Coprinopsis sp. MPI-PUGE-AT-0042]|nr:hypothetical protein BKA70DRAFT_1307622 [Coprinopsis sp. MPI-PUGE-AT-0042]